MLRIMMTLCLFTPFLSWSDDHVIPVYKEPTEDMLKQSQNMIKQSLEAAKKTDISTDLLDMIDKMATLDPTVVQQAHAGINLPEQKASDTHRNFVLEAHEAAKSMQAQKPRSLNRLLVFISFSMPDELIKSLMIEAKQIGAGVVLRGLVENDIQKTYQKIRALIDEKNTEHKHLGLMIDPTLFERFNVQQVPTFVLALDELNTCSINDCPIPPYVTATGNTTLRYFVDLVERSQKAQNVKNAAHAFRVKLGD